jgi:8-oxo-dGTP diphosphatase
MTAVPLAPEHLRFAVLATDVVLFTVHDGVLLVRMVSVNREPHFPTSKGFPGGLIHPEEDGHDAAQRILREKASIDPDHVHMEQLFTFSSIDRDPRGRVVALAYLALVPWEHLSDIERADSEQSWWSPISRATKLAYDHDEMLEVALARLRSRATYTTLIAKLMPKEFTLTELEAMYEAVIDKDLDKRNFRKKILKLDLLKELSKKRIGGAFRPAQLYSFRSATVRDIEVL